MGGSNTGGPFFRFIRSGSVSLAQVTSPVPRGHCFLFVLFNILDINAKRDGYLHCTKNNAERVSVSEVQSCSRDNDSEDPVERKLGV